MRKTARLQQSNGTPLKDANMLDKIKGIGNQLTSLASNAVDGVTSSMKEGAGSISDAARAAASSLNEKAVRAAIGQMRTVLQIAAEELRQRPISNHAVTLKTSVDIGFTALEMQIVMDPVEGEQGHASEMSGVPAVVPGTPTEMP